MTLATLNPWQVLDQIQKEAFTQQSRRWHPATDITESESGYRVSLDLPGMKSEDITIEVKEERLYIKGSRQVERDESAKVHYSERVFGEFNRTFKLPKDANESAIAAKFENGVLQVDIPKVEKAQPRQIAIESR
ncbi:MAG: Hsp20/alpha crystallin family protein [Ketobacteraceae bacterium]|nr:Hsp20/alpha crystallin family protein [Ketobacteraceae bacterium]